MTNPSSAGSGDDRLDFEVSPETYLEALQDVQQQQVELKVDVERIHKDIERFRVFFQTLVSGLLLAIAIAFGIAIWYAYRSFSQQQIARRSVEDVTAMQEDLVAEIDRLESRLQRLERDFPDRLDDVTNDVTSSQMELRRLRDRLDAIEAQLDNSNDDATPPEENSTEPDDATPSDRNGRN
ncbi:hypothetical protein POG22_02830 [Geitlerinema sp. CS-897]|nr:hypothetical protein [Geitlerinema sp. CS-897]